MNGHAEIRLPAALKRLTFWQWFAVVALVLALQLCRYSAQSAGNGACSRVLDRLTGETEMECNQ
jgi:hypothetical protein